ncbi:MAG: DUF5946 family protein [Acidobacteriota bacterium]
MSNLSRCPGCAAELPIVDGPTHRYIGASPACWALFTGLTTGGSPPVAASPLTPLLVDAYAVQHHGRCCPQAIQSVAVHLLTLYGVLDRQIAPSRALWIRMQAVRPGRCPKHERFEWLEPPDFSRGPSVAAVAAGANPEARARLAEQYVRDVWARWARPHRTTVSAWYDRFVVAQGR